MQALSPHPTLEESQAVLRLSALPEWRVLEAYLARRLEHCRTNLETGPDNSLQRERGAAAELRVLLKLADTSQQILDTSRTR